MDSTIENQSVAVVGASGHTGRFVAAELERNGMKAVPLGRSETASSASLDAALAGCAAVINCAGPFVDTALVVADAALRAKIHYLDVTAEQAAVQMILTRDAQAREAGIALLPGAAFYGGLADVLATAAAGDARPIDEITVAVALDSWHPTKGTRLTGAHNTAPRLIVRDGVLSPLPNPPPGARWPFADPFGEQEMLMLPLSEAITLFHHFKPKTVESWINLRALQDVRDSATPPPAPSDERGRSAQTFVMDVIVRSGTDERRATAYGRDIYAVSAPIAAGAVRRLIERRTSGVGGVRSLGEIVDAGDFLDGLVRDGSLRVERQALSSRA